MKLIVFSISIYKQLCKAVKHYALAQSILITILCMIVYLAGPASIYESNDDAYYSLVFSGQLVTSTPDPHVGPINFVLAKIFTLLYTAILDIPWYGLFHVAAIFAAIFFLNYFYAIICKNSKLVARLTISIGCMLPFLFYIQFTKTAFVLAITGYLGLYLLSQEKLRSWWQSTFLHFCATIFLVLSFSMRKESFFMATILCIFLLGYAIVKKRNIALVVTLFAVGVIIIILTLVHQHNYGIEWQNVSERWEKVIGPIMDYDQINYDANKEVFAEAGWSKNDYEFLSIWGFVDEKIYGQEQIDYIFKNAKKTAKMTNMPFLFKEAVSGIAKNYILTALGLTLVLLLIWRQQYLLYGILILVPFLFCMFFLIWQGRLPARVSIALIYFLPWSTLVLSGNLRKYSVALRLAVLVILVLALPFYGQFKDLSALTQRYLAVNHDLHRLGTVGTKQALNLITVGVAFPFEAILPFESASYLSKVNFIWLCSMNQVPIQKKQIAECCKRDIFVSLLTDDATYIIINPKFISILQRYIFEHYNVKTVVVPVYVKKSFIIFKLRSAPKIKHNL